MLFINKILVLKRIKKKIEQHSKRFKGNKWFKTTEHPQQIGSFINFSLIFSWFGWNICAKKDFLFVFSTVFFKKCCCALKKFEKNETSICVVNWIFSLWMLASHIIWDILAKCDKVSNNIVFHPWHGFLPFP